MPSPIPPRDKAVYFVGAGLSSAFGLPNTPSLITEAVSFSRLLRASWLAEEDFAAKLTRAFRFFYPDAMHAGFQPDVVDFFSTLRTYLDVGAGLVGTGFTDAPDLYRLLRRAISHLLIDRTRRLNVNDFAAHEYLTEMVSPGNAIITSNWDFLIEYFARLNGIPLRLTSRSRVFPENEVTLIKLHGSVDWCQVGSRVPLYDDGDYIALNDLQNGARRRQHAMPTGPEDILRVRTVSMKNAWTRIKTRSREPYIVTMATGKADDLGPLRENWRDTYRALSRAQRLDIVGYSMPSDDVEIRTILRTGLQRGDHHPIVTVRNPAPDVHYRVRNLLQRSARSRYVPIPGC